MPRRSNRLQSSTANSAELTALDSIQFKTSMNLSQPKKRRKVANNSKKKCADETLENQMPIPEVPLDILLEIFKELEPNDLLQMARTSKKLRKILMSRSAAHIWKISFMNVPHAPECFEGVSEPQFASLLYEKICHLCGSCKTVYIVTGIHIKACISCISKHFVPKHYLEKRLGIIPSSDVGRYVPYVISPAHKGQKIRSYNYHKDSVNSLQNDLNSFRCNYLQMADWHSERAKEVQKWALHKAAYEKWDKCCKELYEAACEKRTDEIIERLTNEGYDNEVKIGDISKLINHPLVKQDITLTEKIWLDIKPTLIEILEVIRAELKIATEKKRITWQGRNLLYEIFWNYSLQFPPNTILPPAADLYTYKPFRSIIDNAPLYKDLSIKSFKDAIKQLPEMCKDWKPKKDLKFLRMLPTVPGGDEEDTSRLLLATSIFWQESFYNARIFFYPNLLMYEDACDVKYSLNPTIPSTYWDDAQPRPIKFYQKAHGIAAKIVMLCGLNPATTTISQMDRKNPVIECLGCITSNQHNRRFMAWRTAVSHGIHCRIHQFAVLRGAEVGGIRTMLEERYRAVLLVSNSLRCGVCRKFSGSYAGLKIHFATSHNTLRSNSMEMFVDMNPELNQLWFKRLEVLFCPDIF